MICFKYLTAIFLVALIVGCSGAARGVPTEPGMPESQHGTTETETPILHPAGAAAGTATPPADPPAEPPVEPPVDPLVDPPPPAAPPSDPPPQDIYEFNLTSLVWSDELGHDSQGNEYMSANFTGTISATLPWDGLLHYEYTDSYTGITEGWGTHLYKGASAINSSISLQASSAGTVRTLTIRLTSWQTTRNQDGYASSGETYVIGSQDTVADTFTTPDFVRPPAPVYTVSMTPFAGGEAGAPVVEGDKIMFHIAVENMLGYYFSIKFKDNWRIENDVDHSPMWMNPENGGPVQSRERTTMVCCDGDGWLPEAERPEVRTYTAMLWQSTNLRASTTVRLGRTAGNAAF